MALLSARYPLVYTIRVREKRAERSLADRLSRTRFARTQQAGDLEVTVARHASLLRRRLASVDPKLQESKIVNLRLASALIDGLLIRPGETFSFWDRVGPPSRTRGFREGLVLVRGVPATGVGGGLCQLANLLHWMALHTPLDVVERHHHSIDPFPDDRRALPFGTGASVFYNYVDLRLENRTDQPFQLRVWLSEEELHGRIRTTRPLPVAYHVYEVGHRFERTADGVVRCNEVWRRHVDRVTGRQLMAERLMVNRSRVGYDIDAAPGVACAPDGPEQGPGAA